MNMGSFGKILWVLPINNDFKEFVPDNFRIFVSFNDLNISVKKRYFS